MRIIGFIIALVFALAAFFLAYNILGDSGDNHRVVSTDQQPAFETVDVLVAASPIDLGDVLLPEMMESKQWPAHLVLDGFVASSDEAVSVVGQVARATFVPGEPINRDKLSNPEDPSFIAANLPSGMRMVTLSSDGVAGLAGFVLPGDRVDVVVTQEFRLPQEVREEYGVNETHVTETLVSNVKVLAVNQRATVDVNDDEGDARSKRDRLPSSVSLEVPIEDAQRIRLAQEIGYVSLVLRSLEDKEGKEESVIITRNEITNIEDVAGLNSSGEGRKDVVSLVRGNQKTEVKVPVYEEEAEEVESE